MRRIYSHAARVCYRRWERLYYRIAAHRLLGTYMPSEERTRPLKEDEHRHAPRKRQPWFGRGISRWDFGEMRRLHTRLFPDEAQARVVAADLVCDHVFDLLGSGPVRLTTGGPSYQPIDWHRDFKSGYRWNPRTFYRDIPYGRIPGVDVKVPWELSRFQHLTTLGQAYVLTGDPKYRIEFMSQIDDWIGHNPVGLGVNWACTMDVAIRAANWLTAAECFLRDSCPDARFLRRFEAGIHAHGKFIRRHLEGDPRHDRDGTTNHYLADIAGLLFIAVRCPFLKESRRWRRFCIRELIREMDHQVYADGCHFEASTCYHRLALELFFFATVLAVIDEGGFEDGSYRPAAERIFGRKYVEKLRGMFIAVLHLLKPNGHMPQIGDNDSGRFLIFDAGEALDMRYLLSLGAVFFQDPQLKVEEFGFSSDVLWVFGPKGYEIWERLEGRSVASIRSRAFRDAGWYVLRRHRDYCLISCGPNGPHGRGGHAHNDKLGIELVLDGRDVVMDPGAGLYTSDPDRRNRFRATGSHNTLYVEGHEQTELPADLFRLPECVRIRRAELVETKDQVSFEGAIEYAGIVHERTVRMDQASGRWKMVDRVRSPRPLMGRIAFHLSPDVAVQDGCIIEKDRQVPLARIETGSTASRTGTYEYSPAYGIMVEAPCVFLHIPDVTEVAVTTTFSRRRPESHVPTAVKRTAATRPPVSVPLGDGRF